MKLIVQFLVVAYVLVSLCSFSAAITGPHPEDVVPSSYDTEELKNLEDEIPLIHPDCNRTTAPNITTSYLSPDYYSYPNEEVLAEIDWCRNDIGKLRYRLLEIRGSAKSPRTHVRDSRITSYHSYSSYTIYSECKPLQVYVEVCVRPSENARALCSMTEIYTIKRFTVPEPYLAFRPMHVLQLAPGDSAIIPYGIKKLTSYFDEPFSNGGFNGDGPYMLRSVIKKPSGKVLKRNRFRKGNTTSISLRPRNTRGKAARRYNNSYVSAEYALQSCRSNIGTHDEYRTKIEISSNFKKLIRQDTMLPAFEQPQFKPFVSGEDGVVEVVATNPGGGLREGNVPTELMYHWYLRDSDGYYYGKTYPYKLDETGPVLTVKNLECSSPEAGDSEIINLKYYYAEVCNTFGCRRSNVILPRYISYNGSIITDDDC